MINTIVIAAAGRGTRMGELAAEKPKHLIEINGEPFLGHLLRIVRAVGFTRIIVVVGHYADQIESFVEGLPFDVEIVNQFEALPDEYGTAVPLKVIRDIIQEPFVYKNGDDVCTQNVWEVMRTDDGMSRIVGLPHKTPERYGVLECENGFLKAVHEKPANPPTNIINIGIYSFTPDVFSVVDAVELSPRGEYEVTDVINMLAAEDKVICEHITDADWQDLGRPEDITDTERFIGEHYG